MKTRIAVILFFCTMQVMPLHAQEISTSVSKPKCNYINGSLSEDSAIKLASAKCKSMLSDMCQQIGEKKYMKDYALTQAGTESCIDSNGTRKWVSSAYCHAQCM